jgi:hypothetical protein
LTKVHFKTIRALLGKVDFGLGSRTAAGFHADLSAVGVHQAAVLLKP